MPKRGCSTGSKVKIVLRQSFVASDVEAATSFRPGTIEKIEVMRMRVALGQGCFHPDDPIVWNELSVSMAAKIAEAMRDEDR